MGSAKDGENGDDVENGGKVDQIADIMEEVDSRPSLSTSRLDLRPLSMSDAPVIAVLANEKDIHANTRSFPYPYTLKDAESWLSGHQSGWLRGESAVFGMVIRETGELAGAIGLHISETDQNAELGYWLGRDFRGKGYCSEAAIGVIRFGFDILALHRIHAHFVTRNGASGRVMERAGMLKEGLLRQHARKMGQFEDLQYYGALQTEWVAPEVKWGVSLKKPQQ